MRCFFYANFNRAKLFRFLFHAKCSWHEKYLLQSEQMRSRKETSQNFRWTTFTKRSSEFAYRNTSIGVARFVSPIFWYRSLSVSAFKPCHGSEPLRKYINMCPNASKSSLLDCSLPMCVFIDIYRAVPVNDLCSRYGICLFVSKSIYSLANPKSTAKIEKKFSKSENQILIEMEITSTELSTSGTLVIFIWEIQPVKKSFFVKFYFFVEITSVSEVVKWFIENNRHHLPIMWIIFSRRVEVRPIRKFSGLTSL